MPLTFGPYEVLSRLGAGGMGEVFRATDTRLGRIVALKVLHNDRVANPEARARFVREARSIAALSHPNICAIYDVGLADPAQPPYLVMELLEGQTLQDRLLKGSLELDQLVEYGAALADALETAHAQGLIHRDLKPANIFLTSRGIPKILDFGLAKPLAESNSEVDVTRRAADLTEMGTTVGTVAYMSPEQLRAEPLDVRSDLFSFGLVLYEMATGQRAFAGTTSAVVSAGILAQEPVPPRSIRPDLPERLEETILKALEKDRNIRSQSAAELRADLLRLKRQSGSQMSLPARPTIPASSDGLVPAVRESAVPAAPPAPSSSRGLWIGGGIAAVLLIAGGYAFGMFGSNSSAPDTRPSPSAVADAPGSSAAAPAPRATSTAGATQGTGVAATPVATPAPVAAATPVATPTPLPPDPPAERGRGPGTGRRGGLPGGPALVSALKGLPPLKFDLGFLRGDERAREMAMQLRQALTLAGWSAESTTELANAPAALAVFVPQPNQSTSALVTWARRNGFTPDVRPAPRAPRLRIVIGRQDQE